MSHELSAPFRQLIAQHYFSGMAKLKLLEAHVGFDFSEASWWVDLEEPSLKLTTEEGKEASFFAQVLGTYLPAKNQWMWAWANKESQLPEGSLMAAGALYRLGEEYEIPELTTATLSLDVSQLKRMGHALSSLLGTDADAFYAGDNGKDLKVGLLICQSGATSLVHATNQDIIMTVSGGELPFDSLDEAISCFFRDCGMEVTREGETITGSTATGRTVKATLKHASGQLSVEGWLDTPQ